ncbi:MAG: hypothetical protein SPH07_03175 [Eubacteriales bacterium]|nr:hypothetical protein [Eubacteriales bacterium]
MNITNTTFIKNTLDDIENDIKHVKTQIDNNVDIFTLSIALEQLQKKISLPLEITQNEIFMQEKSKYYRNLQKEKERKFSL